MTSRRSVWLLMIALSLAGVVVFFAAMSLRETQTQPTSATVLVWDVPDELSEGALPHRPFSVGWWRRTRPTVLDVVRALDRAAHDDRVRALVLHVGDLDWGWGRLAEVRDAVTRLRHAGKRVYVTLEGGGDPEYFLASAANVVSIPPAAELRVDGLAASATFLRGTLDKLDVHPQFMHAGAYKSAIETYTRGNLSEPAREALEALLDDTYSVLVDSIAASRRLTREEVLAAIDDGPFSAHEARVRGLVDTVAYAEQIDSLAVRRAGRNLVLSPEGAGTMTLGHYASHVPGRGNARVALVSVAGTIASGKSGYEPMGGLVAGAETLTETLREVREKRSIRAVVLRIDSPGGEVGASDELWHEVRRLSLTKPVIVSMSDLAASGGYYLAVPAARIVAQPTTLTGSIGVFSGKLNILGLYRKLGLNVETLSRGRHAQMYSPFSDFTPDEAARFQERIEDSYRLFKRHVSEGRHLSEASVESVAQGRVWSGKAARTHALVDTLGGLETAFHLAARRAHLPHDTPFAMDEYPRVEVTFFDRLLEDWLSDDDSGEDALAGAFPPVMRAWLAAARFPTDRVLALLPWSIRIR